MEKKIAKHVARVSFQASTDLGNLVSLLKEHCSADDFKKLRDPLLNVSAAIGLDILNLIFFEFPDIKQEFDENIKKYGRIL